MFGKVFLHAVMTKKRKMQQRCCDMEWWMQRRQLPLKLRQRVRCYERKRWTILDGNDGLEFISDFPEGLRRDIINRVLCLDLIKKVYLIFIGLFEVTPFPYFALNFSNVFFV